MITENYFYIVANIVVLLISLLAIYLGFHRKPYDFMVGITGILIMLFSTGMLIRIWFCVPDITRDNAAKFFANRDKVYACIGDQDCSYRIMQWKADSTKWELKLKELDR